MIIALNNTIENSLILSQFVRENERYLPDPLSRHIDIQTYCDKLLLLGNVYLYIEEEGRVSGVCMGYMNDRINRTGHIQLLLVEPYSQGRGIGKMLITRFLQDAKASGMNRVELTVDVENKRASHFYNKIGFRDTLYTHSNPQKRYLIINI